MAIVDSVSGLSDIQNNSTEKINQASQAAADAVGASQTYSETEAKDFNNYVDGEGGITQQAETSGNWFEKAAKLAYDNLNPTDNASSDPLTIPEGQFRGMNVAKISDFNTALDTYINGAKTLIQGIDQKALSTKAIKGPEIEEKLEEFIKSIKNLLTGYIESFGSLKKDIAVAGENWEKATQNVATSLETDAQTIQNQVAAIEEAAADEVVE